VLLTKLTHLLFADCVSRGGNFLISQGPCSCVVFVIAAFFLGKFSLSATQHLSEADGRAWTKMEVLGCIAGCIAAILLIAAGLVIKEWWTRRNTTEVIRLERPQSNQRAGRTGGQEAQVQIALQEPGLIAGGGGRE
jgi:hypothetical protein